MLERAVDNVAEDEELGVRVRAEARGGENAVFIYDAQGAEGLVAGRVVGGEAEGVETVEPAVVCAAAGGPGARGDFEVGGGGC